MVCIAQLSPVNCLILEIHLSNRSGSSRGTQKMRQIRTVFHEFAIRSMLLAGATALLGTLALVPTANAQISISINPNPPVCSYGYYDYSPYGCAPSGYYGPGYFYNGVFLGVGPWASWGYGHGWGEHRFHSAGGGRYVAGRRDEGFRGANREHGRSARGSHRSESHGRTSTNRSHASASHSRPSPSHGAKGHGNESHGGGEHH